jgi:hypothetical protein
MRVPIALLLSLSLTGFLLPTHPVFAAEKTNGPSTKIIKRPKAGGTTVRGDAPVALTSSECVLLGGDVSDFSICKSGRACARRDENGTMHSVCITDAK